jgi:uncharacterized protein (DUF1778 family)
MLTFLKAAIVKLADQPRTGAVLRFRTTPEAQSKIEQAAKLATGGNESLLILAAVDVAAGEILRQAEQEQKMRTAA